MLTMLKNEFIEAGIKSAGAELVSLKLAGEDTQYLWQADPKVWGRHAPVLFPIVGRLKNNTYSYKGATYSLSQHGFARDWEFEVEESSDTYVDYCFKSNHETLKNYPFKFELHISYGIKDSSLSIKYTVKNTGAGEMLFSIGAHPGFNCPLSPDETFEDYYIEFEKNETASAILLEHGLLANTRVPVLKGVRRLPLTRELFAGDALIFEGLKSNCLSVIGRKSGRAVKVGFEGFPYMGIWTKPEGAPFICIEPWHGIADTVDCTGSLEEKKGIITLPAGGDFECQFSIEIS